jgi:hypothetical protein
MRRVLLGAVTALIVARPLVSGEDPGRLHSPEAMSGVILNLLWMIAAFAGAIWLAGSPRNGFRGWIPLGLIALALLIGAGGAVVRCYHHPAWLIFGEWATLPLIFVMARELGSDTDSKADTAGGLLAAVLASAVSLAGYGVYQNLVEPAGLPNPDAIFEFSTATSLEADYLGATPEPPRGICRGTFERSDTLVAVLLLAAPALVVFSLTNQRWRSRVGMAVAAVVIAVLVLAMRGGASLERARTGWASAGRMIAERPLLGVGAGNFDRHSPRLQAAEFPYLVSDASSGYLELAATGGVLTLAAFTVVVGLTLARMSRQADGAPGTANSPDQVVESMPRWEFYLGGVAGLLLGLFLRLIDVPASEAPESVFGVGVAAVARALVWFLAFALFEAVAWHTPLRRKAIIGGLVLVLLYGLISSTVLYPAVAQWFWVMAGLGLAGTASKEGANAPRRLWRLAPVPILFVVMTAYLLVAVVPVLGSSLGVAEARRAARHYPKIHEKAARATPGLDQKKKGEAALDYVVKDILKPLDDAKNADPFDETAYLEIASWLRILWNIAPNENFELALQPNRKAVELDPYGAAPLLQQFRLRLAFAALSVRYFKPKPDGKYDPKDVSHVADLREKNFAEARALIEQIKERDAALEPRLRYRLAQALLNVKDPERYKQADAEAKLALELDSKAPGPRWKLPPEPRRQARRWLNLLRDDGFEWCVIFPTADAPVLVPFAAPEWWEAFFKKK